MSRIMRGGLVLSVMAALAVGAVVAGTARGDNDGRDGNDGHGNQSRFCDTQCLRYQTTLYLQAIVQGGVQNIPAAGGPSQRFPGLRISPHVVVTDNSQPSSVGAGSVWTHHIAQFQFRETFADTRTQQVISFLSARDNTTPTPLYYEFELRLGFTNGQISQIEEIFSDPETDTTRPFASTVVTDRLFDSIIPEDERSSPQTMIEAANDYWSAFTNTTPNKGYAVPIDPDCTRLEHLKYQRLGAGDCLSAFSPGNSHFTIVNRRFYVVDEERGVVVGIATFQAPDRVLGAVPEVFKIQNGLITELLPNFGNLGGAVPQSGWADYKYPGIRYPLSPSFGPVGPTP